MIREKFEKYLGKNVKIELCTGDVFVGYLRKTGEEAFENSPNLYLRRNYYFTTKYDNTNSLNSCLFRASHVRKVEVLQ